MRQMADSIDISDVEGGFSNLSDNDERGFWSYAEAVIAFQRSNNPVYSRFEGYQFLPIDAFKMVEVCSFPPDEAEAVFKSSGTASASKRSHHYVRRLEMYERSVVSNFTTSFGRGPFHIVGIMPTSEEVQNHSSLFRMMQILINHLGIEGSRIIDASREDLNDVLCSNARSSAPTVIFGLGFALLDIRDEGIVTLPENTIVIETGGMKTQRREISRAELHGQLSAGFQIEADRVTSEYGMCELMSQFYMGEDGLFYPPPWVRFKIFDPESPESELEEGKRGALAIIDLANLYSVSCILTQDSAIQKGKGFELLGRLTGAELRGCNFLLDSFT